MISRHIIGLAGLVTLAASGLEAREPRWTPGWASSQMRVEGAHAQTLAKTGPATIRQIIRLTASGRSLRLRLSNLAGTTPLRIGAASLGRATPGRASITDLRTVTFGGQTTITIAPGAEVYSDPIALPAATGGDLGISLFLPETDATPTGHPGARATTFLMPGDAATRTDWPEAQRIGGWWHLSDVEVADAAQRATIVAIGDSITDGYGVVDDSYTRWPDILARRLAAAPATRGLSILNAGIGGNRVLLDGLGPNLMARFDREVLAKPQIRHVILLEGVNDLGTLTRERPVDAAAHRALVQAVTTAYRQLVARAHGRGIRVIGGTITPFQSNDYYHPGPETEADRQAINSFIRHSGVFDAVIDFDRVLRDPAHPDRLLPAYDSGDHLHPSPVGYRAMAEAVPLSLFAEPRR